MRCVEPQPTEAVDVAQLDLSAIMAPPQGIT
jgi:hypothetical protein